MNIEEYRNYCLKKRGAAESFPFPGADKVLVFKVGGKMFTATDVNTFESISLKCDPELVEELRERYSAVKIPAYFDKRHWNRILMDNSVPDKLLYAWIDHSYDLVVAKLPKRERAQLQL